MGYSTLNCSLETAIMRRRQNGFSLIELLIVVAIILIIAAIAIPSFMRAKIAANESSAVSSVHAVTTAEISYATMFPLIGNSVALADLGDGGVEPCAGTATAACFIDPALATGKKSGYTFTYVQDNSATPAVGYTFNGDPIVQNVTGQKGFYADQNNVIRYASPAPANSSSAPI